jgi:hypothetical protein
MITKDQIVLFIFFLLLINNQWKIIMVLIFIFFYFKLENPAKQKVSLEVQTFNDAINKINFNQPDNFYYKKFLKLETLKDKYPIGLVRHEQIKTINGMLLQIPLTEEEESKWLVIRDKLSQQIN